MKTLKLRPWPFKKDEEVELYWICSPFYKPQIGWFVKVAFKRNNEIKLIEFPWGTLPYLRTGQKYKDGFPSEKGKKGFVGEIYIENGKFDICTSFDMPYNLYYFYKNYECGSQKLCRFKVGCHFAK